MRWVRNLSVKENPAKPQILSLKPMSGFLTLKCSNKQPEVPLLPELQGEQTYRWQEHRLHRECEFEDRELMKGKNVSGVPKMMRIEAVWVCRLFGIDVFEGFVDFSTCIHWGWTAGVTCIYLHLRSQTLTCTDELLIINCWQEDLK